MKRFLTKVIRFLWSWGFLKFILAMIALVILLYVEEDWRGAHAWAATKAKWEARGESFDYNKFIPRPVPDDQNLAALPLFKLESEKGLDGTSYMGVGPLNRAMRSDLPTLDSPPLGNWMRGELPDMTKVQKVIAADYQLAFPGAKSSGDTLAQFNAIYPFFADFMAASGTRPLCRFNLDYTISPPVMRPLGPITAPIKLSKIITLHAVLALDHHQPDLALADIKTNYKLLSGTSADPSLVGGLVAIGVAAIDGAAIYDGLARHAWNDAQLVELQDQLAKADFLSKYQFTMRGEIITETIPNYDWIKLLQTKKRDVAPMYGFYPAGWLEQDKTKMVNFLFRELKSIDPQSRRAFPDINRQVEIETEQAESLPWRLAPWNLFFVVSAPTFTNISIKFAVAQVWIDEARIACALERYHLAKGVYPNSLDALAPADIAAVPHDIMNGQPYHYQLRPDGTFALYSVGWNQIDDGGKVVYKTDSPSQVDYEQGDWVWPTPQIVSTTH